MKFIDLLDQGSPGSGSRVMLAAAAAGINNTIAIVIINDLADDPTKVDLVGFAVFAVVVGLSLISARWAARRAVSAIEHSLQRLKLRIVDQVRSARLADLERVGRSEIFDRLNQNLTVISLSASLLGVLMQSVSVFILVLAYLVLLSPLMFGVILPLIIVSVLIYRLRQREIVTKMNLVFVARLQFIDRLMDMIRGAKEIKLNRTRAVGVEQHFRETSASLRDLATEVNHRWQDNQTFLVVCLFLMLAVLVFVVPQYVALEPDLVSQVVIALMFAWGSIQGSIFGYTKYVEAEQSLAKLVDLETKLKNCTHAESERDVLEQWVAPKGGIELRAATYRYPDSNGEPGFGLGPIDLEVNVGEILFIVGGNGAGKSTLLKLLTGLYSPHTGGLRFGEIAVGPHNVAAYREQLSVIFTDVHLFQRAYGLLDADPAAAAELLRQMEIDHKTAFADGRFTKLDLSTGQRKRLAMVLALLEDRPIVVLDEWAADQDPEFRRHFYENMLPSLKQQGKTVIAVSHDDRYFHCADRVIVLDYGEVREEKPGSRAMPSSV
ncbi:MAG: cyclic peptide export ABC transporter [Myxococcota bacterium]